MQMIASNVTEYTFQNGATAAGNGNSLIVEYFKTLTIGITGNTTNGSVEFHGVDAAGNDNLILGFKLIDLSSATSTTGNNETWQIDITGLHKIYFKTAADNITVKGRAVA